MLDLSNSQLLGLVSIYSVLTFFFCLIGGHGTVIRAVFFAFGVPADITLSTLQVTALANRLTSIKFFIKQGLLNIKHGFLMMGIAVSSGFLATYLLLEIDQKNIEIFVGILLLSGTFHYLLPKKIPVQKYLSYLDILPKKIITFLMIGALIINETFGVITGGAGIISNTILTKYFRMSLLQAMAIKKFAGIAKAFVIGFTLMSAGVFDLKLILWIVPAGIISTYIGMKYFSKKSENFLEKGIVGISLCMGIYLVGKYLV